MVSFAHENGTVWLSRSLPVVEIGDYWSCGGSNAIMISNLICGVDRGDVDWRDSLIERPSGV